MIRVSPTRMELLKLKKKQITAVRGHKLLKDKLDELIRLLIIAVKDITVLRKKIDAELTEVKSYIGFAGYSTFPEAVNYAIMTSRNDFIIEVDYEQLLNFKIPKFKILSPGGMSNTYGFAQTSAALDFALTKFNTTAAGIIRLAEKEKKTQMICDEIEKTRRRVNALEYILIPEIEETVKYIKMKIDELERNKHTQLMRIKDVVRS